jgi:3-hydroxyacyl-CoA dehydrogenase/enoyl-CoA hydratase/3-hydroxybutyryl-CoA epimerase/3-hydroxyacyl-CoA dehydrogenase/enoyl-CoA hydratase/3-hydroxybutyryl-CoA epimerase/enoyl-CoA isomerase
MVAGLLRRNPIQTETCMSQTITREFSHSDIAVLTIDTPGKGANVLSASTLEELETHLRELADRPDVAGLILRSGKPGMFIAGADLREFAASLDAPKEKIVQMCQRGQQLFGRLSQLPFPTVAAMDGICVGGGAELAVWCDRRLMTDGAKSEIGFPEVKLGLFPGWGGTARLPRIVGIGNAVQMITSGESVDGPAAYAMGLVTDVVPPERLLDEAVRLVRAEQASRAYQRDRQRWRGPLEISETELGFLGATAAAYIQQQTKGHYPAPMSALEVMLEGAGQDVQGALQLEAREMSKLFGSPIKAEVLNFFFLSDRIM